MNEKAKNEENNETMKIPDMAPKSRAADANVLTKKEMSALVREVGDFEATPIEDDHETQEAMAKDLDRKQKRKIGRFMTDIVYGGGALR